jgi:RNA polymerase sporulation-specific sigma factor
MYIRKNNGLRGEISFDEPLNVDRDGNELLLSDILGSEADTVSAGLEQDEEKSIILDAVRALPDREREIIELRFGLSGKREMTQKETAKALGISQSYISRLEKRIIERLKKEISGKI